MFSEVLNNWWGHHDCIFREIQKINTGQLYDLNQVREDLKDLFHHEPARLHKIMEKIGTVKEKLREKLAMARHLIYCIENSCDVCYPGDGVRYE